VAALLLGAACAPQEARTDRVTIFDDINKPEKDWGYAPAAIVVEKGTPVLFVNNGVVFHTVTSDDPKRTFDLGVDPGARGFVRFTETGLWTYHCGVHPAMVGKVRVCDGACG
jgi:plastocyanin